MRTLILRRKASTTRRAKDGRSTTAVSERRRRSRCSRFVRAPRRAHTKWAASKRGLTPHPPAPAPSSDRRHPPPPPPPLLVAAARTATMASGRRPEHDRCPRSKRNEHPVAIFFRNPRHQACRLGLLHRRRCQKAVCTLHRCSRSVRARARCCRTRRLPGCRPVIRPCR